MKVLIVNSSDIQGGAAKAAYRLHRALIGSGINSQMLVQFKSSDDFTVIGPITNRQKAIVKIRYILDAIPLKFYKERSKTHFSPSWVPNFSIVNKINQINPDIVHLHWINEGMIRIEDLTKIKAPIVWSLHDNWAFTGGCHIKWECEKYKKNCGNCPRLYSNKENDLSRTIFKRKEKIFSKMQNLTIIGLSKWLEGCAKESTLLKDKRIINLPNLINANVFKAFDKKKSRELWNLPEDKKLILFGAMSATSDVNKGFKELCLAFNNLKGNNIELVVFGSSAPKKPIKYEFPTRYVGSLKDDISLVSLYNTADVMIVPSLQENLSNVIMESMACGTPVVAFDIGGNSDLIEHKINGYLAKPYDVIDLANGIEWVIANNEECNLKSNSRNKITTCFESRVVSERYISVYQDIISKKNSPSFNIL